MARTIQINVKITPEEAEIIDKWIDEGDFESKNEFIRFALRKMLKAYDGQRMGFELSDKE